MIQPFSRNLTTNFGQHNCGLEQSIKLLLNSHLFPILDNGVMMSPNRLNIILLDFACLYDLQDTIKLHKVNLNLKVRHEQCTVGIIFP